MPQNFTFKQTLPNLNFRHQNALTALLLLACYSIVCHLKGALMLLRSNDVSHNLLFYRLENESMKARENKI